MHVHKVAKTSKTRYAVFYTSKTHDLINARKFAFWYCILMQRVTTSTRKSCKIKTEIICFRLCSICINRVHTLCKWMYCKYKPENQYFVSNMDRPINQLSKYHHLRAVLQHTRFVGGDLSGWLQNIHTLIVISLSLSLSLSLALSLPYPVDSAGGFARGGALWPRAGA